MNANGSSQTQLTFDAVAATHPAWSPDGLKIAFVSGRHQSGDGNFEIYSIGVDGMGELRLTTDVAPDLMPAYSPDGMKIAFTRTILMQPGDIPNEDVWVMASSGGSGTRLTTAGDGDTGPEWSPDGSQIAFTSRRDGLLTPAVYTMNADGSSQIQRTTPANEAISPAWSPDGSKIVFTQGGELWTMNPNGSSQTPLTSNSALSESFADWGPGPAAVPPTVSAGGPYSGNEGTSVALAATGSGAGPLTFDWDLDDNGSFETAGQNVSFAATDGPATRTVRARATNLAALFATNSTTVTVANVAPTATFSAPATARVRASYTLSLTSPQDPSPVDTAAGFTYAFDCGTGAGFGVFGMSSTASCTSVTTGAKSVKGRIRDKDGGVTESTRTIGILALPRCHVPNVIGKRRAAARALIVQRNCRVGRVGTRHVRRALRGRVLAQNPRGGRTLANGARVNLTVGV